MPVELLFHRTYEVAEMLGEIVAGDCGAFDELDWDFPGVRSCLTAFSRPSLLAHFAFVHIAISDRLRFRKDPETVDAGYVEKAFERYQIQYASLAEFTSVRPQSQDGDDALYLWMQDQEDSFQSLWGRMADEVFHLLFGNRGFLLTFNQRLAEYRKDAGHSSCPRRPIPQWLKRAVYFRERGKCAVCKTDLSGLIALDAKQHYDHIVPLASLGINDPCNIQLLCEACNLSKGASPGQTSDLYESWWKLEV